MSTTATVPDQTRRSSFVTSLAWVFIVLSGLSTFMTGAQNLMLHLVFPDFGPPDGEKIERTSEQVPAFAQFMFDNFHLLFAGAFVVSLAGLISSIGLLKRRNWARIIFIGLMAFGILWNLGGIVWQYIFMSQFPISANAPQDVSEGMETMMHVMVWLSVIFALFFVSLFGWIIWKLTSSPVRAEFS